MQKEILLKTSIVLPIISAIAVLCKIVFKIDLGTDGTNALATLIATCVVVYGVLKGQVKNK